MSEYLQHYFRNYFFSWSHLMQEQGIQDYIKKI